MTEAECISALAAELRCAICLSLAKPPLARLRCCHSFCRSCLLQALDREPRCPLCKERTTRRNICGDNRLDKAIALFAELDSSGLFLTQLPAPEVAGPVAGLCEWADLPHPESINRDVPAESSKSRSEMQSDRRSQGEAVSTDAEHDRQEILEAESKGAQSHSEAGSTPRQRSHTAKSRGRSKNAGRSTVSRCQAETSIGKEQPAEDQHQISDCVEPAQEEQPKHVSEQQISHARAAAQIIRDNSPRQQAADSPSGLKPKLAAAVDANRQDGQSGRKIPARLQPWSCPACTFQNPGSSGACAMCGCGKCSNPDMTDRSHAEEGARPKGRLRMPKGMATGSAKNTLKRAPGLSPALQRSPAAAAAQCGPSAMMAHPQHSQPLTAAEPMVPAQKSRCAVEPVLPAEIPQPPAEQIWHSLVAKAAPAIQSQPSQSAEDRQQPADGCAQPLASAAPKVDAHRSCAAKRQTGQAHDPAMHAQPRKRSKGGAGEEVPAKEPEQGRPKSRMPCEPKRRSGTALKSRGRKSIAGEPGAAEQKQASGLEEQPKAPVIQQRQGTARNKRPESSHSWDLPHPKWVILPSGLSEADKELLQQLQQASGACVVNKFQANVTHVICGKLDKGLAKRTVKFILGVLNGKWAVHASWVEACLAAGRPVPEAEYEVAGDSTGKLGGPLLGRLQAGLKLLLGWEAYLHGSFSARKDVEEVVRAAGAKLLTRLPPASETLAGLGDSSEIQLEAEPRTVVLVEAEPGGTCRRPACGWEGTCVSQRWIMDSASTYIVQPFADYLVNIAC